MRGEALLPALLLAVAFGALPVAPARADVVAASSTGFVLEQTAETTADPADVYALLGHPSRWWSAAHSYSGNADNLSLALAPGGCFCEKLPGGGVEHGRVLMAWPGRMLRLSAALGPLQAMPVQGVLTFELKRAAAEKTITRILLRYAVSGPLPADGTALAAAVDGVLAEQFASLIKAAGAVAHP